MWSCPICKLVVKNISFKEITSFSLITYSYSEKFLKIIEFTAFQETIEEETVSHFVCQVMISFAEASIRLVFHYPKHTVHSLGLATMCNGPKSN